MVIRKRPEKDTKNPPGQYTTSDGYNYSNMMDQMSAKQLAQHAAEDKTIKDYIERKYTPTKKLTFAKWWDRLEYQQDLFDKDSCEAGWQAAQENK
jgi:hypothetical protein